MYFGTRARRLPRLLSLPTPRLCRAAGSTHSVSASSAVSVSGLDWCRGRRRGALPYAEQSAPCLAATFCRPPHGTSAWASLCEGARHAPALLTLLLARLRVCCLGAHLRISPSPSLPCAVSQRTQLDLHITLLKRLQTLIAQRQAKGQAGKGPRASQAPPTLPGNLAASLEKFRDAFDWSAPPTGPAGAGWQSVASTAQAAAVQAQARSVASYYTHPDTVALLKANPSAVPAQLRGPAAMTRQQACQEANKMELPTQVRLICSCAEAPALV